MQTTFRGKAYEVQLDASALTKPLVQIVANGELTELLHPVDCLLLGVHNSSYFHSKLSEKVQAGRCPKSLYFANEPMLDQYFSKPLTELGLASDNYFGISASSSYDEWLARGWIQSSAPEGQFEAYVQYATGFNCASAWAIEQKRLLSFISRHSAQLAVATGNLSKRRKQRQALLNWSSPLAFI